MAVLPRATSSPSSAVLSRTRVAVLMLFGLLCVGGLLFLTAGHALAADICTVDTAGANDEPGQKDLTKMCANYDALPTSLGIKWQWDQTDWSGNNSGDACSLYDTDGDGNANYSLCITVKGSPAAIIARTLYRCDADSRTDRCGNGTSVTTTATCSASVQGTFGSPVDPFYPSDSSSPRDTVGACTVSMSEIGGGTSAVLLDVCSYPSQQPNSDPSDCVIAQARKGKLEVRKVLSPTTDTGKFNLLIDSTLSASAVGNGGTTGEKVVSEGNHTVSESASTGTSLSNYNTTIVCRDLNGTGSIIASSSSASPLTVNVAESADVVCTITNSRKTGALQVTKTVVWNGVTPDTAQTFQICITGPSYATANCQSADYDGTVLTWTGLLPGQYNIAETDPGASWSVNTNPSALTVSANLTGTATVVNTRKLGSIQVNKYVNWNGITPDTGKTFQLCIQGPSYPTTPNCKPLPFNGGNAVWNNLIPGSYAVTETDPGSEWATVITSSPAVVPTNGSGVTVEVTNTRKRGALTVTKTVNWNGVAVDPAQQFNICIQGPSYPTTPNCQTVGANGGALNWTNLLPGSYTVTETDPGTAWTVTIDGSPAVVPITGQGATATVTNARKLGRLEVTKTVNWNGVTADGNQSFQICITGPSYPTPNCQNAGANGGLLAWDNLIPGSYTIGETDPGSAWDVQYTTTGVSVPTTGGTLTAGITNTRKLGSLEVTKVVELNGAPGDPAQQFTICIQGPSYPTTPNCQLLTAAGGLLTWPNLIPGSYTVTENDPGSQWEATVSNSPATVPDNGGSASATVTNARKRGSLTINKVVEWNGIPENQNQVFQLCIQGPSFPSQPDCKTTNYNGGVLNWSNLIPGTYAVSESALGSEWTVTIQDTQVTVPVTGGGVSTSVINARKLGSLDVTKNVNWNGSTADPNQSFTICIQGPSYPTTPDCKPIDFDGGVLNWSSLIPGNYTVTEPGVGAEWTTSISPAAASVPINGGAASVTIDNVRKRGSLTVNKTVDWKGIEPDPNATFEICIQGPSYPTTPNCQNVGYNGGPVQWDNLIPGEYTVAETTPSVEWYLVTPPQQVTVPADGSGAAASILNQRKLGSLAVTKVVDWKGAAVDPGQNFTLCITGPSFTNGDCKSVGPNGGQAWWFNLIPGNYALTEAGPGDAWTVSFTSQNISVPTDGATGEATVTNTRKLGSLEVTKTVNWNGVLSDPGLQFQVCINGPSYPQQPSCQFVGSDGGVLTWTDLIAGNYTVSEPNAGSEWQVDITNSPALVPVNGGKATASISNTRKLATIEVTKVVEWNGIPVDATQQFAICLSGPSFPTTPDCKTVGAAGGLLSWANLIPGSYTVTENDPGARWSTTITTSPVIAPADGGTATATVTNTRKRGSLTITKVADWNGVTEETAQQFTICLSGPSFATSPDCKTVGSAGGPLTWTNLLPGDYTVTENDPGTQWTVVLPTAAVTVPEDGSGGAGTVTNTRKLGSIEITKIVNWNGVPVDNAQGFSICLTGPSFPTEDCKSVGPNGGVLTWSNLIPGIYTMTETNPGSQWTVSIADANIKVTPDGGKGTGSVTNTRKLGSLTLSKTVNWNGVDVDNGQGFQLCIQGPSYPAAPNCQSVGATGGDVTWTDLIPGAYSVTEVDPGSAWSVVVGTPSVTVPADGGQGAGSVTNTRKHGSLTVTKVVEWNGVTVDPAKQFQVCILGPSFPTTADCKTAGANGAVLVWNDLLPGSYTVYEQPAGSEWAVTVKDSPAVVPADGQPVAASIVNARKLGSLEVLKQVNWNGVTPDSQVQFSLCIQGPSYPTTPDCKTAGFSGGSLLWEQLIPGEYTVTEPGLGAQWTLSTVDNPATVPTDGGKATVTVSNTRKLGSLAVAKTVNWNGVTVDNAAQFELCITGPSYPTTPDCRTVGANGGVLTWYDLVPGSYTVTETDAGIAWTTTVDGSPATVPTDGGEGKADVTNSRKLGGLQVTKTVNWNGVTEDVNQQFEICIAGPSFTQPNCKLVGSGGGVLTWTNLVPGSYTVTETYPGDEWTTLVGNSPVDVPLDGGTAKASVSNTRKLGSLEVTKSVNWNGVTVDPAQKFEICITGPSYQSGNCQEVGASGGVLTWNNLVPGNYTVSETGPGSQWQVEVTNNPAAVPANGGMQTATVTNTRKLASLDVTKIANWNGVTPDTAQQFTICITGPSYPTTPNCKQAPYDGGLLTWTGLIPGEYVVTETDPGAQWVAAINGSPALAPADGGRAAATVTNTRKHGSLSVTKVVEWNGVTPDTALKFELCIKGPSFPDGNCKTVGYNGGVASWPDLLPGEYTVTETDPGTAWTVDVVGGQAVVPPDGSGAVATFTNTRKLGSLDVTKAVDWNGVAVDEAQTFQLCITGPSYPTVASCKTVGATGGVLTWTALIPGDYVVTETEPGSAWTVTGSGVSATVPTDGGKATAQVSNARKLGSLQVTKTVNWNGITANSEQVFQICIKGPSYPEGDCRPVGGNGGALLWENLIPGDYQVAEIDPGAVWSMVITKDVVAVPEDGGRATAGVTNTRNLGSLTVTKVVEWNGVPVDDKQTFQVCITGPSFPTPDCQVVGANGGVLNWADLLPGAYTVTETNPGSAWSVKITGSPAVVPETGAGVAATVLNTRKLGSLEVVKTVNWNGVAADNEQTFQICVQGPSYGQPNCKSIGFSGGALVWPDLIPGQYTVAEQDPGAKWTVTTTGSPATVAQDGSRATAAITNTLVLDPARIVVTKIVTETKLADWSFVLRLDNGEPHVVTKAAPTTSWENLAPNRDYVLSEDNVQEPWFEGAFVCSIDGKPAGVTLANAGIRLTPQPGDVVLCEKYNGSVSGTGLDETEEPLGGMRLYLPTLSK